MYISLSSPSQLYSFFPDLDLGLTRILCYGVTLAHNQEELITPDICFDYYFFTTDSSEKFRLPYVERGFPFACILPVVFL